MTSQKYIIANTKVNYAKFQGIKVGGDGEKKQAVNLLAKIDEPGNNIKKFGRGFYTTTNYEQAEKWAWKVIKRRKGTDAYAGKKIWQNIISRVLRRHEYGRSKFI